MPRDAEPTRRPYSSIRPMPPKPTMDRLVHHATILQMNVERYRRAVSACSVPL